MTSAEKLEELRRAILAAAAAPATDDDEGGAQLALMLGVWSRLPKFVRRRLLAMLPDLSDAAQLDDWLGLGAAVALELRSDEPDAWAIAAGSAVNISEEAWDQYVDAARLLLDRVRGAAPA